MWYYSIFIFCLGIIAPTSSLLAQQKYYSRDIAVNGGISYYGSKKQTMEGNRGEFGISTGPSTEGVDSSGLYYVLYPMSVKKPQTNLEYYPGAQKIYISFSFDTAFCYANDMRYSVTSLDSTINTGWSVLPKGRWVPQGGTITILFMEEELECKDKVVFIKLYNINNPESVITEIVSTRELEAPQILSLAISNQYNDVPKNAPNNMENYLKKIRAMALKGNIHLAGEEYLQSARVMMHTAVLPFFFRTYLIRDIKGVTDTVNVTASWEPVDDGSLQFIRHVLKGKDSLDEPLYLIEIPPQLIAAEGKYQLLVTTADYLNKTSRANLIEPVYASDSFEISRSYVFKLRDVLWGAGVSSAVLLALFLFLKYRQRKKIRAEKQATKEARLSLQAVQSQLNPHFIFNALSGIQNLLNKQENEKANNYLTTFSRLTRNVLNDADKEMVPLNDEIKLLNDYLQMEQLRFGFTYSVETGNGIDTQNTEIPPMLLQPFAENAVKHGVAVIKQEGKILIKMHREGNDLIIEVRDNGKGFDFKDHYDGKGLVLSKNRISLLNTVYGDIFGLDISSALPGTIVTLKIKSWLK